MLTQQPQPAGSREIEISEVTSQDREDKMRMGAMKESDIGHMLDVGLQNWSSLPFSCLAIDAAINGAQSCWNLDGGSVIGKRQTDFIYFNACIDPGMISWVRLILLPIGVYWHLVA